MGYRSGSILSAILCLGFDFKEIINYFIERTCIKYLMSTKLIFLITLMTKG